MPEPRESEDVQEPGAAVPEGDAGAQAPADEAAALPEPDERLLTAHDVALAALHEIADVDSIGGPAGHRVEPDGVVSLLFENRLLGYPGWFWTVSLAVVDSAEPTVLEAELLPGDDALIAPEWVPWSVRLKEYQAQQRAAAEAERAGEDEDDEASFDEFDEAESDVDADDDDEFSEDGSAFLHSGDVDGVDIDELDPDDEGPTDERLDGDQSGDAEG